MTPRERFIHALECRPPVDGRVPHFELVFYLTMPVFGRVHPLARNYAQWDQYGEAERALHRRDMTEIFVANAKRFEHDAIFLYANPLRVEEQCRLVEQVRELSGDRFFLLLEGDATFTDRSSACSAT